MSRIARGSETNLCGDEQAGEKNPRPLGMTHLFPQMRNQFLLHGISAVTPLLMTIYVTSSTRRYAYARIML